MHKKLIITFLLAMTILTAGCSLFPDKKNVATVIQDYSGKLEKCEKTRQRKLLVPNSYITREINNTGGSYTGVIPVGGNLVLCNRQDITSASLNISLDSLTTDANNGLKEKLSSTGFFDTMNYPTSKFILRNLSKNKNNYTMIGDLTIKDITKTISFNLNIAKIETEYNFTGEVYLDISKRNITPNELSGEKFDNLFKFSFDLKTKTMTQSN